MTLLSARRPVLAHYEAALRAAAAGRAAVVHLHDPTGTRRPRRLPLHRWCGGLHPGDHSLLARCAGPTLDVGCGPGRLTAALTHAGRAALGIDISPHAIALTRRRGAPARHADVFTLADRDAWRHVLLADGNIGIGGNPTRLLHHCTRLLAPGGDILVELDPPGTGSWHGPVTLHHDGVHSHPFPWAAVAADDLTALTQQAAMTLLESWTEAHRWFARLSPT
ncbi:MAG TPA: class I SAM-dependent methyltransferase [Rugosimonospora sp.]|nr:class I SAM-dependent methyltransferase [Rugosimonospora sp.]